MDLENSGKELHEIECRWEIEFFFIKTEFRFLKNWRAGKKRGEMKIVGRLSTNFRKKSISNLHKVT